MQKKTLEFPHNARLTYTAIKLLFEKRTKFSSVKCMVCGCRHSRKM